jgi:hypothetical protein
MPSRAWLRALIFVVFLCFGLGVLTVVFQDAERAPGPTEPTQAPKTPTATIEPKSTNALAFNAVLVLGVDRLAKNQARLEAVWVVAFPSSHDEITLFGLPIDASPASAEGATLASLFSWTPKKGVDEGFLSAMSEILPFEYQSVVVIDEAGFSTAVDFLGGADLAGETFGGDEVLAFLDVLQGKPEAALVAQAEILSGLRPGLQALGATPDVAELIALHPEHVYLSDEPFELAALITPLLPFDAGTIRITTALDQAAP